MPQYALAGALTGVAAHHLIFRPFESIERHPTIVALLVILGQLTVYVKYGGEGSAFKTSLATAASFVGSLCLSAVVYRLLFHPLRSFPGPPLAGSTKLWAYWKMLGSGSRWYRVQAKLQEEYGDYVRTGPRELLVSDSAAIPILNGATSKFTKGPWYDMLEPSLQTFRNKNAHHQRRRIWDKAFSTKALAEIRPVVESFTDTLLSQISTRAGEEVQVTDWFGYYSYDVMSAMAFGDSLDMMKRRENSWVLKTLREGLALLQHFSHILWAFNILMTFPSLLPPIFKMTRWARGQLSKRKAMKSPRPDLFQHLLVIDDGSAQSEKWLMAEARLIIAAGSDTISTALSLTFLYLARYPEELKKLQSAVDEMFASQNGYNCTRPADCPHLEGVINEVLRLHPAVPGGVQRVSPPEGATIGDKFIPGNTICVLPTAFVTNDERNFAKAKQFIPERWYSQPELKMNKQAFLPFSTGPYGCVGKGLAMMELRSVVARIVKDLDVKLPPGFDVDKYLASIKDSFTTMLPPLKLVFSKRS